MATRAITQRRSATEPECQNHYHEAENQQGHVDDTDDLPAAEPSLTAPSKGLKSRPETMREVEPESYEPHDVKHTEYRIREGLLDPFETICRTDGGHRTNELGKHHVVPEVPEVQ